MNVVKTTRISRSWNYLNRMTTKKAIRVKMFGPKLSATSGISAVVNNWLAVGFASDVDLEYVATLDEYVPGQRVRKAFNALRSYLRCVRITRLSTDIVHIHVSSHMSFYRKVGIFVWCKVVSLPIAVHLHGSSFMEFYDSGLTFQRFLIRFMFERSSVVLALSESWAAFISTVAPRSRVVVLYNGAPADLYSGSKAERKEIVILFMGRLGGRKGTLDLLEAFAIVASASEDARLILGGDGDVERFRVLASERGLADKVSIPGWVGSDKKTEMFVNCDIYVLPSYNEGLPGSILEAMAAGKPIISTPVGGIAEAVSHGVNGFLVDPGDVESLAMHLSLLVTDAALRDKMGSASRDFLLEKFESTKLVNRLVRIYDAAIDQRSDKLSLLECQRS